MKNDKLIKKLEERKKTCLRMIDLVDDKEVKAQYWGEMVGLDYAIGLLSLEK